jgi:hypothetical protein
LSLRCDNVGRDVSPHERAEPHSKDMQEAEDEGRDSSQHLKARIVTHGNAPWVRDVVHPGMGYAYHDAENYAPAIATTMAKLDIGHYAET